MKVVEVEAGFKYNENAFRNWFILSLTMVGYGTWAGSPYSVENDMVAAWYYNFIWTYITWGIQLLL